MHTHISIYIEQSYLDRGLNLFDDYETLISRSQSCGAP